MFCWHIPRATGLQIQKWERSIFAGQRQGAAALMFLTRFSRVVHRMACCAIGKVDMNPGIFKETTSWMVDRGHSNSDSLPMEPAWRTDSCNSATVQQASFLWRCAFPARFGRIFPSSSLRGYVSKGVPPKWLHVGVPLKPIKRHTLKQKGDTVVQAT